MKNILVLGSTGMAGHVIYKHLEKKSAYNLFNIARNTKLNEYTELINLETDFEKLDRVLDLLSLDIIINCVGILNENAEKHPYEAILINSLLPRFLENKYFNTNTKIVHLSTDCVFSGKIGGYEEQSFRDGNNLYSRTKAMGELENAKDLTIRTSIIGPDMRKEGIGLFNWFMKQDEEIRGFRNSIWTGVTTIELAKFVEYAIDCDVSGVFHLVPDESINKYNLLCLFKDVLQKKDIIIKSYENNYTNKSLINTRKEINYMVPNYREMLLDMKEWIQEYKELYRHYL